MNNDEQTLAREEVAFLFEESCATYKLAEDEIWQIHEKEWDEWVKGQNSFSIHDEVIFNFDVFLAGYADGVVSSQNRDWNRIYDEIKNYDLLQRDGVCNWMIEGAKIYPKLTHHVTCIVLLRYKMLDYIGRYLLKNWDA